MSRCRVSCRSAALLAITVAALGACQPGDGPTVSWQERWRPGVQIVGDTVKRRRGEMPPAHSAFFDGRTVRLRAARGEVLGVQVLLQRTGFRQVSLSFPVPGVTVESFDVGFLDVTETSSTGEYGHSSGLGAYPDILRSGSGPIASDDQVFFDVAVAASAQPGLLRGELVAGSDRFPVELTVEPIEIHIEREPWVWVWSKTAELMREHGLPDEDGPAAAGHRARLLGPVSPPRVPAGQRLLSGSPAPAAASAHAGRALLAGGAVQDRSGGDGPTGDRVGRASFAAGRSSRSPSPSTSPAGAERDLVRQHGEAVHRAGGGPDTLPFMVTDAAAPIYRGAVDVFCSPLSVPPPPGWGPPTRFWTYNGRPPRAGNMTIDKPGTALRTWGWIGARHDVGLWYAWEGMYYRDRYNLGEDAPPTDVLHNPLNDDERHKGGHDWGNGDGLLMYPGPVPSLRLKALRRGLQDRLLLRRLAACGPEGAREAAALARRMVPAALGAVAADDPQTWPDDENRLGSRAPGCPRRHPGAMPPARPVERPRSTTAGGAPRSSPAPHPELRDGCAAMGESYRPPRPGCAPARSCSHRRAPWTRRRGHRE